ncbi:hypothetical protein ACFQY5_27530 [Paeniroseomonas aquatica]|uniref:hypothetical protein n=1 Tax=Paeniroseomonas aquatica TaxID=373043 RepID=UPI003622C5C7
MATLRHDVDDRIDGEDQRAGRRLPDRRRPGQRGPDQLALEVAAAAFAAGVQPAHVAAGPGEEGDLVDRADHRRPPGDLEVQPGESRGIAGEALDEGGGEDVEPVGPAVVAEVPDHLHAGGFGGAQQRQHRAPVVLARRGLGQVPAHPVARRADAVLGQLAVILLRQQVVPRAGDEIEPPAVAPPLGRAFKAAQEGRGKQAGAEGRLHGHPSGTG